MFFESLLRLRRKQSPKSQENQLLEKRKPGQHRRKISDRRSDVIPNRSGLSRRTKCIDRRDLRKDRRYI